MHPISLVMDRAYEGNETRQLALDLGYAPVVPPLSAGNARKVTRVNVWKLTHLRRYSSVVESGLLVTSW